MTDCASREAGTGVLRSHGRACSRRKLIRDTESGSGARCEVTALSGSATKSQRRSESPRLQESRKRARYAKFDGGHCQRGLPSGSSQAKGCWEWLLGLAMSGPWRPRTRTKLDQVPRRRRHCIWPYRRRRARRSGRRRGGVPGSLGGDAVQVLQEVTPMNGGLVALCNGHCSLQPFVRCAPPARPGTTTTPCRRDRRRAN